eukprot:gnl/TRDRNA2_/TRDRNA2_129765_c0_seq4.p1 gnl/TRDRNA2_/TRDRNA2_129765_c0~~gnl/TRDRNA2_/TRDRNA2_129765_c0_seq4.p1  ORF type:complete len:501 (+),score=99.03 gnl/TRDRNA2_/TRDRNA2_129765_c0_seq4:33-1535(+)
MSSMEANAYHPLPSSAVESNSSSRLTARRSVLESRAAGSAGSQGSLIVEGVPAQHPLAFVDEHRFHAFIGIVICANIAVLWGETDSPGWLLFSFFDNLFLVIFTVELVLKLILYGPSEYWMGSDSAWHYLDTAVVFMGIFDQWLTPLLTEIGMVPPHSSLLRFLRLLRLVRLLRVFKMFDQLMAFVNALAAMVDDFFWIFSVLGIFLFSSAIVLTQKLRHGEALGAADYLEAEHGENFHKIQGYFANVPTSFFTLFQVTTMDNWDDIADPLIEINSFWRLFFVFFIAFASWSMISVLTAIASDNMIAATTDKKAVEQAEMEARQLDFVHFLGEAFAAGDTDGNGLLDLSEFQEMMEQEEVRRQMKDMGVLMSTEDMEKMFVKHLEVLATDQLELDEFIAALSYLQEGLAAKHVVNIDYSLKRLSWKLDKSLGELQVRLQDVVVQTEAIVTCVRRIEEKSKAQEAAMTSWQKWVLGPQAKEFRQRLVQVLPRPPPSAGEKL